MALTTFTQIYYNSKLKSKYFQPVNDSKRVAKFGSSYKSQFLSALGSI